MYSVNFQVTQPFTMISLAMKAENMHSYGNEIGFSFLLLFLFLFEKQRYM